jgi:AraC-like DNA-binding protein
MFSHSLREFGCWDFTAVAGGEAIRNGVRRRKPVYSDLPPPELDSRKSKTPSRPTRKSMYAGDIVVTRHRHDGTSSLPPTIVPNADAFSVIVQLEDFAAHKVWRDGKLHHEGGHSAGTIAITDQRHRWICHHNARFDNLRFQIPMSRIINFNQEMGRPNFSGFDNSPGHHDPVVMALAQALLPAVENPDQASQLYVDQVCLAVLTHISQTYAGMFFPSKKTGLLSASQQKRALAFLVEHLDGEISVADLAKECGLSRSHFIKAFKDSFGLTPHRWLTEYRIGRVKELLKSSLSIAEIAVSCGFADQSHLTRAFNTIVGTSPGAWRKASVDHAAIPHFEF